MDCATLAGVSSAPPLVKFPRTPHLLGSALQRGDEDLPTVKLDAFRGAHLVVTEKVDGTNLGLRFDDGGRPWLQSRGHLIGSEAQFDLLKQWAHTHAPVLFERLGTRWLVYGEWLFARHTVFYDALPAYWLVFDAFDLEREVFIDTATRTALLAGLPVDHAPVLWSGPSETMPPMTQLLGPSRFRTAHWRNRLIELAQRQHLDVDRTLEQADDSNLMEGLYFRAEKDGTVQQRFKFVRPGFRQALDASASHWASRPLIANQLRQP